MQSALFLRHILYIKLFDRFLTNKRTAIPIRDIGRLTIDFFFNPKKKDKRTSCIVNKYY